ncbi:hypothetical protein LCI18_005299 [Fusarium solani-melongenae]|uniref:Uncharacterized protein n=1 Tax=Fusarium solani subsp. cucurbitae TaxID=2747967 RepID=A0ACD3YZI4_FUSSC|nr:hypothetical protein LCI18_005299 [Fusarium solani-melongenae]
MPKKLSKNPLPQSSSTISSLSTITTSSTASGNAVNPALSLLPQSLTEPSLPLPKLIVFDLDYTLWPFWVDTHVTPPLKPNAQHSSATDRYGEDYGFYCDVPSILYTLPRAGPRIGVASRTSAPGLARDLLKMLHIPAPTPLTDDATPAPPMGKPEKPKRALEVFDGLLEIYPGSKIRHFESLQKRTGIRYEDMLFFDDESRNRDTESLGVTMWLVRDGVSWGEVEAGVNEWRKRRGFAKMPDATELP